MLTPRTRACSGRTEAEFDAPGGDGDGVPAASVPEVAGLARALQRHVRVLAEDIGERNVRLPQALRRAADYISGQLESRGFVVTPQLYDAAGMACANLEVAIRGRVRPEEIILLGAHYDTVRGSPGADDNASGVAALLEISDMLQDAGPACTVRCVAFVNEEAPFFFGRRMGSMVYARAARARGDRIRLMLSLEMLGYYRDEPGSQGYPPLLRHFYPDRGNFLGFVSNLRSRRDLHRLVDAFHASSTFPAESAALPWWLPGVAWSDHSSFWRQGYAAVMVTDTAFYRNPNYHTERDTPDTLDYRRMAEATLGLASAVARVADQGRPPAARFPGNRV